MIMKKTSGISKVESKAKFSENMIEDYMNSMHHPEKRANEKVFAKDFENIDWCSEHSQVVGNVEISFWTKSPDILRHRSVPIATGFWVVCTKKRRSNYKVTWSCSLS